MSEENNNGSANAGAPEANTNGPEQVLSPNADAPGAGSPADAGKQDVDWSQYVSKEDYEELGKKLSVQGTELGDYRQFYKDIAPLLDKIQDQPEIAEAILEGKLTTELVQAISEGKIDVETAKKVGEANKEVKQDLGAKKYAQTSAEDIEKLIAAKVSEEVENRMKGVTTEVNQKFSKSDEKREFIDKTNEFISAVDDFQDYADEVATWLEEHPTIYDIDVAYYAVKGKKTVTEAQKEAEKQAVEQDKLNAQNAGGGQSLNGGVITDRNIVDSLIASNVSPNS